MRSCRRWPLAAVLLAALIVPARAGAVAVQPVGSFDQPIYVTSDPANPDRLFVVQRAGLIKLVEGGSVSTFADLTSVVRCCDIERGLFSMALPPDFPQTGLFYVYYTGLDGPGNLHIAELRASGSTASISTLRNVLTINHSTAANHNGGQLQFGRDGDLYIATGDGGAGQSANAQNTNSLLGKVLRIDPRQNGSSAYSVPQSNPFVNTPGADEIWAYGLRNPWRFSFDRATGDLLIADVGESSWEEVDYAPATAGSGRGANYGWAICEGFFATGTSTPCGLAGRTDPVFTYATHVGGTCAITGGYVARDPSLGDLVGRYLYADLCVGQVRSIIPGLPVASGNRYEGVTVSSPVSFGEDSCGRLYVVEQNANVFHLAGSTTPTCAVLRVTTAGQGKGTVTGPGIDCPGDCVEVYPLPQTIVLRKHLLKRSNFSRWQGDCSGRKGCSPAMTQDRHVIARFSGPLRTRVKLKSARHTVAAGARALLRARARPCRGRRHDVAKLYRGRKQIARKRLDRRCRARFRPKVGRRARFRAKVKADRRHRAGKSRFVRVVATQ